MTFLLTTLTALVMVVLAPVGLRLVRAPFPLPPALWVAAGLGATVSLLLPRGPVAVAWAAGYAALCLAAALGGGVRLLHDGLGADRSRSLAALTATTSLAVAGAALLVERYGTPLFGFDLVTWRLTVLHFHVAGFAAAVLAGLTLIATRTPSALVGTFAVPLGTALVAAGHFLGAVTELAGAAALTIGLLCTSWAALRHVVRLSDDGGQLLAVAALATPFTMALAMWWAVGEAVGLPHPTLTETAATHGLVNALGVGVCGVLGWTTLTKEQL